MKSDSPYIQAIMAFFSLIAVVGVVITAIQRDRAQAQARDLRDRLEECKDYRRGMRGDGKEGGFGGLPAIRAQTYIYDGHGYSCGETVPGNPMTVIVSNIRLRERPSIIRFECDPQTCSHTAQAATASPLSQRWSSQRLGVLALLSGCAQERTP